MARYTATLETPRTRRDVAAYLSDFATTQEWDPGVVERSASMTARSGSARASGSSRASSGGARS